MSDDEALRPDWLHPRTALERVLPLTEGNRQDAISALVRRLVGGKITSLVGEYRGPKNDANHLYPEFQNFPLWRGVWLYDVFKGPTSSVWSVGDIEASISGEQCYFFNVRLRRADVDASLSAFGGSSANDNRPAESVVKLVPSHASIEPKWAWEEAMAALIAVANGPDGLEAISDLSPQAQGSRARLAEWFASYFSARHPQGEQPADSECRRRANLVLRALTALR